MKPLIFGFLFGLVAPVIGLFAGLQVSPFLGSLLMFPIMIASLASGIPYGRWGVSAQLGSLFLSGVFWAIVWFCVHWAWRKWRR